jgi:hypothetical protein
MKYARCEIVALRVCPRPRHTYSCKLLHDLYTTIEQDTAARMECVLRECHTPVSTCRSVCFQSDSLHDLGHLLLDFLPF